MSTSFKSALKNLAMIVALWAPVYLALGWGLRSCIACRRRLRGISSGMRLPRRRRPHFWHTGQKYVDRPF
jgi:hypothetical protein